MLPSDYAVRRHGSDLCTYRVTHRTEIGDEVLVRLEVCDINTADEGASAVPSRGKAQQIVFQFDGGCLHGITLDSYSADLHEALLAMAYFSVTDGGMVGSVVDGIATLELALVKESGGTRTPSLSPDRRLPRHRAD